MAQTNVNFKMDKKLKEDLKEFCEGAGMTMSILFNIVAKNIVANHQIPFMTQFIQRKMLPKLKKFHMKWMREIMLN